MTDKDIIVGLKCLSNDEEQRQEKARVLFREGKSFCERCVFNYYPPRKKGETCPRPVAEVTLQAIEKRGLLEKDDQLFMALECLACRNHKQPARNYSGRREKECRFCAYAEAGGFLMCDQRAVFRDALKVIQEKAGD